MVIGGWVNVTANQACSLLPMYESWTEPSHTLEINHPALHQVHWITKNCQRDGALSGWIILVIHRVFVSTSLPRLTLIDYDQSTAITGNDGVNHRIHRPGAVLFVDHCKPAPSLISCCKPALANTHRKTRMIPGWSWTFNNMKSSQPSWALSAFEVFLILSNN